MPWWKFEQNMLTVLPLAAQTSTEHYLDPASEETTEQWIYWFIYCMLLPHRSKIIMRFISQLFTFTDITDCFCNSCVFNVNSCVNENLRLLTCHMTAAFCARASDVCTQKTVFQKFKLIWFKTHDFSVINMIIRTKTDVFSRYELKWRSSILERGRGATAHLDLKKQARKSECFCFHSK